MLDSNVGKVDYHQPYYVYFVVGLKRVSMSLLLVGLSACNKIDVLADIHLPFFTDTHIGTGASGHAKEVGQDTVNDPPVLSVDADVATDGVNKNNSATVNDGGVTYLQASRQADVAQPVRDYTNEVTVTRPNVSQQFMGVSPIQVRLGYALPEIAYSTEGLSDYAKQVNAAIWQPNQPVSDELTIKIQALLNWHYHSVGAVDGDFGQNVVKAMQVFQLNHHLPATQTMTQATWQALTADSTLVSQPVLVRYQLTSQDVHITRQRMQYLTVTEALAEKFHMSQQLLVKLNPKKSFKAGQYIIVYNPYQPNVLPVSKLVADKKNNILFAYDEKNNLLASYPTTVGSRYTPSPKGVHQVRSRVINPFYNSDFSNKNTVLPPGPNNPVGRVWLGLSKKGYGIHGSPYPEKISRQVSHGCVRLTNWDALALWATVTPHASVEFL